MTPMTHPTCSILDNGYLTPLAWQETLPPWISPATADAHDLCLKLREDTLTLDKRYDTKKQAGDTFRDWSYAQSAQLREARAKGWEISTKAQQDWVQFVLSLQTISTLTQDVLKYEQTRVQDYERAKNNACKHYRSLVEQDFQRSPKHQFRHQPRQQGHHQGPFGSHR